jgi:hypothetical protein
VAVLTDSPFQTEEHHRDQAQVEQMFTDLVDGSLPHLSSGRLPRMRRRWTAPPSCNAQLLDTANYLASRAFVQDLTSATWYRIPTTTPARWQAIPRSPARILDKPQKGGGG